MSHPNPGAEACALPTGTYTVGGKSANALPIASLGLCSAAATLIVPPTGAPTIQRLVASVVVRLDGVPIGIAPVELRGSVMIEFEGRRLRFKMDDAGLVTLSTVSSDGASDETPLFVPPTLATLPVARARIVKVRTGESIELGNHRVIVGRDATCDFLVSGPGVSRRHFSVAPVQGGYMLRDESANGTVINGSPVSGTYLLGHGDVMLLDEEELRFELDGVVKSMPAEAAAPTAILDMSRIRRELKEGDKPEAPAPTLSAILEIVRGQFAGASFPIERPACSIGRGPQSDVRVRDDSISTNHATLLRKGSTWFVVDLRSANGTFVDGFRVAGERELMPGSRLKLGTVEMVFRPLNSGADAPAEKRKEPWLTALLLKPFRSREARLARESSRPSH